MEEKSMRFRWVSQTLGLITPLSATIGCTSVVGSWELPSCTYLDCQ